MKRPSKREADVDQRGRVRRTAGRKLSTKKITAKFHGGPLAGRTQVVSLSTYEIAIGVGVPFWVYVRVNKTPDPEGFVNFVKRPSRRMARRFLPRVK